MKNIYSLIVFALITILPQMAFAGAPIIVPPAPTVVPNTPSGDNEFVASIGIRFELGETIKPVVVGSVRYTDRDADDDVTGALGEVSTPITPTGDFLPTFRILGIFGNDKTQGLAGLGFNTENNQPLIGLGIQGKIIEGGANIQRDGTVTPYLGANTYEGPD